MFIIIVNAFKVVKKTQSAETVHQRRNFEKDCLASLNRLSSPAFRTRIKRKIPNLKAQIRTKETTMRLLRDKYPSEFEYVKNDAMERTVK